MNEQGCQNSDRELFREIEGDYYSDKIFVTKEGGIGINCGGSVIISPIRNWFQAMKDSIFMKTPDAFDFKKDKENEY